MFLKGRESQRRLARGNEPTKKVGEADQLKVFESPPSFAAGRRPATLRAVPPSMPPVSCEGLPPHRASSAMSAPVVAAWLPRPRERAFRIRPRDRQAGWLFPCSPHRPPTRGTSTLASRKNVSASTSRPRYVTPIECHFPFPDHGNIPRSFQILRELKRRHCPKLHTWAASALIFQTARPRPASRNPFGGTKSSSFR